TRRESSDRIGILDQGRLVGLGSPEALKKKIGGDVIVLESGNPEQLRNQIQKRFGDPATVLDGMVRIERPQGHKFITELVEAFPGQIDSVTLAKPSLEDVFIQQTGHRFWETGKNQPVNS
ncbi:MAG: DUF4162 domain-containing protein, partial [Terriglobia bacterium]